MTCERCNKEARRSAQSFFNTERICLACKDREEAHARYHEAVQAEQDAVRNGDVNFPGIGLPAELHMNS